MQLFLLGSWLLFTPSPFPTWASLQLLRGNWGQGKDFSFCSKWRQVLWSVSSELKAILASSLYKDLRQSCWTTHVSSQYHTSVSLSDSQTVCYLVISSHNLASCLESSMNITHLHLWYPPLPSEPRRTSIFWNYPQSKVWWLFCPSKELFGHTYLPGNTVIPPVGFLSQPGHCSRWSP